MVVKSFDSTARCGRKECTAEELFGVKRYRDLLKGVEGDW